MNVYWVGNGVFSAKGGKDYGYGEKLPDGLDKEMVKRQIAKGNMAESVPSAVTQTDESVELRKMVADAQAGLLEATNKIKELDKECDDLAVERDSLNKQLEEANQTIQQLTAQLTTPQLAGPKEGKK